MLNFFRNIRKKLAKENNFIQYSRYAIGEIVLVVLGILIALQINNNNESTKLRAKEVQYLENLKTDLNFTIIELEQFIEVRNSQIASANKVIEHFNGNPITDPNDFNRNIVNVYMWKRFFQINNTFQELTNSGNLAIISNDSIKNGLLNMESLYKKIKYNEDHFRYDAEVTLYNPSYGMLDINPMAENYLFQVSNGNIGSLRELQKSKFDAMLTDIRQKNGFAFAILEFTGMNLQFESMKSMSENLIRIIDYELNE